LDLDFGNISVANRVKSDPLINTVGPCTFFTVAPNPTFAEIQDGGGQANSKDIAVNYRPISVFSIFDKNLKINV